MPPYCDRHNRYYSASKGSSRLECEKCVKEEMKDEKRRVKMTAIKRKLKELEALISAL